MIFRFGEDIEAKNLAEVIASMANSGGGIIHLPHREDIENLIENSLKFLDPPLYPPYRKEKFEDKLYWIIFIPDGYRKPYLVEGKVLIYREGEIKPASHQDILNLIKRDKSPYDERIVEGVDLSEINFDLIQSLLREKRVNIWPEEFIKKEGLLKERKPTVASLLLFGYKPEKFVPGAYVEVISFNLLSTNKIVERKSFYGCIIDLMKNIEEYLLTQYEQHKEPEEVRNIKTWFEEAFENSLLHRDYSSPSPIQIWISPEMLKIWNPGEPFLSIESFGKPHPSIRRNPNIYRIYELLRGIKSEGCGTIRMIWTAKTLNGNTQFMKEWEGLTSSFKLKLEKQEHTHLNERQKIFLQYLERGKKATRRDYEKLTGVSERTARLDLADLLGRKKIKRVGKGRNIHYILETGLSEEELFTKEF